MGEGWFYNFRQTLRVTGKSLSEALLFAEHGENMLCTKIVLNVRNNIHCLSKAFEGPELEIFTKNQTDGASMCIFEERWEILND